MPDDPEVTLVGADTVRAWARDKGLEVGTRGHLSMELTEAFNRRHRKRKFINNNPSLSL